MTIMGLTGSAEKALSATGYYAATIAPWEAMGHGQGINGARELSRRYTGWVFRCASLNANSVAALRMRVFRQSRNGRDRVKTKTLGDKARRDLVRRYEAAGTNLWSCKMLDSLPSVEEIVDFDHPVVGLFHRANPYQSQLEFMEEVSLQLDLTGNAFLQVITPKPEGYPTELHLMMTQFVKIVGDQTQRIGAYIYHDDRPQAQVLKPSEVVHIRYANPTGYRSLFGIGPMAAAVPYHDLSTAITETQIGLMRQGARPGLVLYSEDGLEPKAAKRLQDSLDSQFADAHNAGRSMVLSGKFKVMHWTLGEKDVGYHEAASLSRDFVAQMFGVPKQLLTSEDVNRANAMVGNPQYQEHTILPRARRVEGAFNEFLMPLFWGPLGDDTLFVAYDNPVAEDANARADRASKIYMAGLATRDEMREIIDLDPVGGDEGESYYKPPAPELPFAMPAFGQPAPREVINEAPKRPALPAAEIGADDEIEAVEDVEIVAADVPDDVPTDPAGAPAIQDTALNGAQAAQLREMLLAVDDIGEEATIELIRAAFPTIAEERVRNMVARAAEARRSKVEPPDDDPEDDGDPVAPETPDAQDDDDEAESAESAEIEVDEDEPVEGSKWAGLTFWLPSDLPVIETKAAGDGEIDEAAEAIDRAIGQWFKRAQSAIVDAMNEDGTLALDISMDSELGLLFQETLADGVGSAILDGVTFGLGELPDVPAATARSATDAAQEFAAEYLVRLSESTLETVKTGVESRLRDALSGTIDQDFATIQREVADAVGQQSGVISRRIARTESVRMHNAGRELGWVESGMVEEKQWITRGDGKVSAICREIASKYGTAKVGEPFVPFGTVVAGKAMTYNPQGVMTPGDSHPNCRCRTRAKVG